MEIASHNLWPAYTWKLNCFVWDFLLSYPLPILFFKIMLYFVVISNISRSQVLKIILHKAQPYNIPHFCLICAILCQSALQIKSICKISCFRAKFLLILLMPLTVVRRNQRSGILIPWWASFHKTCNLYLFIISSIMTLQYCVFCAW